MSKDGRVITDEEFKRAAIRRQQRWAARQHMAQMAVLQKRDFQLGRQLELRKQLDAVQKIESYRKVKVHGLCLSDIEDTYSIVVFASGR